MCKVEGCFPSEIQPNVLQETQRYLHFHWNYVIFGESPRSLFMHSAINDYNSHAIIEFIAYSNSPHVLLFTSPLGLVFSFH